MKLFVAGVIVGGAVVFVVDLHVLGRLAEAGVVRMKPRPS